MSNLLQSILEAGKANYSITVNGEDLKEFADTIVERLRGETQSATENAEEEYLTRKEVMKLLKVCETTLVNWQNRGYLVPSKVGNKTYYKKSDVLDKMKNTLL